MAIQNLTYFYDQQMVRFLQQLVRGFSGFQYQTGWNANGSPQLVTVPCTLANTNRQVANILRNNSENTLNSAPRITLWQTGLKFRKEDLQYPGHVESVQVTERAYSPLSNKYGTTQGNLYTVQRLMPRPFEMEVQLDLWTTTIDQKYQLMEQILTIICPSFDIQNSQNALDWTALAIVFCEDINFSSRNIPIGTSDDIDIATIKLRIPMWLSPPAQVQSQTLIQQIVSNIYSNDDNLNVDGYGVVVGSGGQMMGQDITTPNDHHVAVAGKSITLLGYQTVKSTATLGGSPSANNSALTPYEWEPLLGQYGSYRANNSSIKLYYTDDFENGPFVIGTFQIDPSDGTKLIWSIDPDTLPANTLAPFTAMIDPLRTFPGQGLATPALGARYLIANDIGPSLAWGAITAHINDIIEYTTSGWVVSFDSRSVTTPQLVLNLYTGSQLRWTGSEWVLSIDATYAPGFWRLKL